jgi:hypothetical protein
MHPYQVECGSHICITHMPAEPASLHVWYTAGIGLRQEGCAVGFLCFLHRQWCPVPHSWTRGRRCNGAPQCSAELSLSCRGVPVSGASRCHAYIHLFGSSPAEMASLRAQLSVATCAFASRISAAGGGCLAQVGAGLCVLPCATRIGMRSGQVTTRHRIQHLHAALSAPCPRGASASSRSVFGHDVMRAVVLKRRSLPAIFVWSTIAGRG